MRPWHIAGILVGLAALIGGAVLLSDSGDPQAATGTQSSTSTNAGQSSENLDAVPSFSLESLAGETVALEDSAGTIRVINSWASWCPFCIDELPAFAELQQTFPEDVTVIAINRAESRETAQRFAQQQGVAGDITVLLDRKDTFYQSIGGFAMPETLFVDGDGNIRIHKRGPMEFPEMKEKVQRILDS